MNQIVDIDSQRPFELPSDFNIPLTFRAGVLLPDGGYRGGGSITFKLTRTPRNELILNGRERGMIRVAIYAGSASIWGEMIVKSDNEAGYSVEIIDIVTSAFNRLQSINLRDIYLDDLNHEWTWPNVTAAKTAGYIYPFVDYGYMEPRTTRLFNISSRGSAPAQLDNDIRNDIFNFRPAIFVNDLMQRVFRQIGWEIDGIIFTAGNWFTKIIMPFSNGEMRVGTEQCIANSGAAYVNTAPSPPLVAGTMQFQTVTNALFSTILDRYTATESSYVQFRALLTAENLDARRTSALSATVVNSVGVVVASGIKFFENGQSGQLQLTGFATLEAGDWLQVLYNSTMNAALSTPNPGSRFEVKVLDTMAYGSLVKMAETLPDMTCADFVRSVAGKFCMVFDQDKTTPKITLQSYEDYYLETVDEVMSDKLSFDGYDKSTIASKGQNNYLNFAGDNNYANGGFFINDKRVPIQATQFQSAFAATPMHAVFNGLYRFVAKLFDGDAPTLVSSENEWKWYSIDVGTKEPRLLFVQREEVGTVAQPFASPLLQIGTLSDVDEINLAYSWHNYLEIDSDIQLSFVTIPEGKGIGLQDAFWRKFASDQSVFEIQDVLASLLPADLSRLSFRNALRYQGNKYRLLSINNYSDKSLTSLTLLRAGMVAPNFTVTQQIGSGTSGSSTSGQPSIRPEALQVMTRIQVVFDRTVTNAITLSALGAFFSTVGQWNDFVTDGYVEITEAGYYAIFLQATQDTGDASAFDLGYTIRDEANTLIFMRTFEAIGISAAISNEEQLSAGDRVYFFGAGAGQFNISEEFTFATITQRSKNG